MNKSILIAIILFCALAGSSQAAVRLPEALGDHMVLQQQTDVLALGLGLSGREGPGRNIVGRHGASGGRRPGGMAREGENAGRERLRRGCTRKTSPSR